MTSDGPDDRTFHAAVEMKVSIPTPSIVIRSYFSSYLLHEARRLSEAAGQIEAAHSGRSRFDQDHRGHVLASLLCCAGFIEAMINELSQDALESHGVVDKGYVAPLDPTTRDRMAEFWRNTNGKHATLGKYQMALLFADRQPFDRGAQPFQDAARMIQLRNALAHFQPESVAANIPTEMEKRLRGKFDDCVLMKGPGNAWWPDGCLGHGCADWAWRSALALADSLCAQLDIKPNYRRVP